MKIVFFGSGEIAIPVLEYLIHSAAPSHATNSKDVSATSVSTLSKPSFSSRGASNGLIKERHGVVCVVTTPDMKKGRHLSISFTSVKEFAVKNKLKIFQPATLTTGETADYIRKLEPDIFIVFSYGKIIPGNLLNIPKLYPINIHASLLPKYRGAAPINWALINGESKTGITIIKMNEKMDEGDIILKKEIDIEYFDNAVTLEGKLSKLAKQCIQEVLLRINKEEVAFLKQDNSLVSFAPKLKKEDGRIIWNKPAFQIVNRIKGCFPWPGSCTYYENKLIKVFDAEVIDTADGGVYVPGEIVKLDKKGILVAAKENSVLIKELQPTSGKKLSAWQFIQGYRIEKNKVFE